MGKVTRIRASITKFALVVLVCLLFIPSGDSKEVVEHAPSWTINFPLLEHSCNGARVKLYLSDAEGRARSEFSPSVSRSSVWNPGMVTPGQYTVTPVVTDCGGQQRELTGMPINITTQEMGRMLSFIARGTNEKFDLLYGESCAIIDGGDAVTTNDTNLVFVNVLERDLVPCLNEPAAIVLKATEGNIDKELARGRWPEGTQVLRAGGRLELGINLGDLALDTRQKQPRIVLDVWVAASTNNAADYGWTSLVSKPFTNEPCCDVVRVDVTSIVQVGRASSTAKCSGDGLGCRVERAGEMIHQSAAVLHLVKARTGQFVHTHGNFVPVESIKHLLGEESAKIEDRDAWGNGLSYWSDGRSMLVASPGCDGRFDLDYERVLSSLGLDYDGTIQKICIGETTRGTDLVFAEDNLCRWPQHTRCPKGEGIQVEAGEAVQGK